MQSSISKSPIRRPDILVHPAYTPGMGYSERRTDGSIVKCSPLKFIFPEPGQRDSMERTLELRLSQSIPNDETDTIDILLLPLTVSLIESYGDRGSEDYYTYSIDGDFIDHGWRCFSRDPSTKVKAYCHEENWLRDWITNHPGREIPNPTKLQRDHDPSKLFRYGEPISQMILKVYPAMTPELQHHPTVERLRNHNLWEFPHNY